MKKILVVQPLRPEALALLASRPDVAHEVVTDFSPANLAEKVVDADAITIRDAALPQAVLERATRLKVVSRHGVGYENIPVDYCTQRRVPVTIVGGVNAVSVAEHTLYLILSASRRGPQLDRAVRTGDFGARSRLTGRELNGRTLLLVGYGRIGRAVAQRARAFGVRVVVFDPYIEIDGADGVERVARLADGLARADIVSLHIPKTRDGESIIGANELAQMKRGSILINTARGGLVDEAALEQAMASGHVRAAGLDVFEVEPLAAGHALAGIDDIVLTPHSAALTEECLIEMGMVTVRNALAGIDGTLDRSLVVNPEALVSPAA